MGETLEAFYMRNMKHCTNRTTATAKLRSWRRALGGLALLVGVVAGLQPASAQTTGAPQIGSILEETGKGKVNQPALKQHPAAEVRSAQGECVREANRRGYSVIDTSNFQKSREGWSIDLRARDRRGRSADGTCFVYTKTNEVSLYGFGWDDDDWSGQDRMEFVCASVDSRYRECQLPVDGRARVVKRLSDASCIEGKSYGQRGDKVWVDEGCRARFEVTRSGGGGGWGNDAQTIQCLSDDKRYKECRVGPGYTARLVRELSKNRCQRDSTWGTRNGVVWVTAGCRGEFQRVRGSGGRDGGGAAGLQSQAAAAATSTCANEARRLNLQVAQQNAPRAVPGGYRVEMYVRTGRGEMRNAVCSYSFNTGRARIEATN
jgi:hypothetical protein